MADAAPPSPRFRRLWIAAGLSAAAALTVGARITDLRQVYTPAGVRFIVDGDPYYHARRAWQILETGRIPWTDPWLNYPRGAEIPWPPLFDVMVAESTWTAGLGDPSREQLLEVAAWVPVALAVAGVLASASLARELFGTSASIGVALLLAVFPSSAFFGMLGRPDQHVLEFLLFALLLLAFARAQRHARLWGKGLVAPLALGLVLALAFWSWPGTPILVAFLLAAAVGWRVLADPDDPGALRPARTLAVGGAIAAVLLVVSIALGGAPGALGRAAMGGLTGFAPLVATGLAAGAALLLVPVRIPSRGGRATAVLAAYAALGGLAAIALPGARHAALDGIAALRGVNPFFSRIREFMPFLFSTWMPLRSEARATLFYFGLAPLLLVPGALELRHRWRENPAGRHAVFLAAVVGIAFFPAAALVQRMALYAALPLAVWAFLGLAWIARRPWSRWTRAATVGAAAVAAVAPGWYDLQPGVYASAMRDQCLELLARFRERGGPPGAVLSWWDYGHFILWEAERPVLASPFGTEGGPGSFEDLSAFFLEKDAAAAEALLERRGIRWILLHDPTGPVSMLAAFYPGRAPVRSKRDRLHGPLNELEPGYFDLVAARLYQGAGGALYSPTASLGAYRLVDESLPFAHGGARFKLFERVPGVRVHVRGSEPGRRVMAEAFIQTPVGGRLSWTAAADVDGSGRAELRLPYATGRNGAVYAGPWRITDMISAEALVTSDAQVEEGADVELSLHRPLHTQSEAIDRTGGAGAPPSTSCSRRDSRGRPCRP